MTIEQLVDHIAIRTGYGEKLDDSVVTKIIAALRAGQDLWRYGRAQKGYEAAWNASQEAFEAATKGE
jgi:hypothetical protein